MELVVTVYNINPGDNEKLLTDCPLLGEYMQYMNRVRQYTGSMDLAAAVCIFEFDEEKFKKVEHEAGVEEGIVLGMEQGLTQDRSSLRLLIQRMTEAGEAERLPGLADEVFLLQMYEKYQL